MFTEALFIIARRERNLVLINRWVDKENVVCIYIYTHDWILFFHTKENSAICSIYTLTVLLSEKKIKKAFHLQCIKKNKIPRNKFNWDRRLQKITRHGWKKLKIKINGKIDCTHGLEEYCKNVHVTTSTLQIQSNFHQNSNDIFHRNRTTKDPE